MVVQGNWTLGDLSAGERGGERTVRDTPQNISGGSLSTSQAGPGARHTVSLSFRSVDAATVVAKAGSEVKTRSPPCPNPLFYGTFIQSNRLLITSHKQLCFILLFKKTISLCVCGPGECIRYAGIMECDETPDTGVASLTRAGWKSSEHS